MIITLIFTIICSSVLIHGQLVDMFTCSVNSSQSIFLEYRCDGYINCDDGSDELDCFCPSGKFRSSAGYCVKSVIEFVSLRYCHTLGDKQKCVRTCSKNEFRCSSDKCIPYTNVCDGKDDCAYSIDEWSDCDKNRGKIDKLHPNCKPPKLPCYLKHGPECVDNYEECFYLHECEIDGCEPDFKCNPGEWRCYDAPCLNKSVLCDGKWQCFGGTDESDAACDFKKMVYAAESGSSAKTLKWLITFFLIFTIGLQLYYLRGNISNQMSIYFKKMGTGSVTRKESKTKPLEKLIDKTAIAEQGADQTTDKKTTGQQESVNASKRKSSESVNSERRPSSEGKSSSARRSSEAANALRAKSTETTSLYKKISKEISNSPGRKSSEAIKYSKGRSTESTSSNKKTGQNASEEKIKRPFKP